jgi:ABC-type lipoprotein export system ATPase subunit
LYLRAAVLNPEKKLKNPEKPALIFTEGVSYAFGAGIRISFPDLKIEAGEHWLITGRSGSGKTTLLHILAGLRLPQTGKVHVNGVDLTAISQRKLDHFRGKNIGIVFQTSHFVQSLSVAENLQLAQYLAGEKADKKRINELLQRLGLSDKGKKKPTELSIGEQQRAAIARALVNKPAMLLADEPTASLDDENCRALFELLKSESDSSGASLVIVTHDQRLKDLISNIAKL